LKLATKSLVLCVCVGTGAYSSHFHQQRNPFINLFYTFLIFYLKHLVNPILPTSYPQSYSQFSNLWLCFRESLYVIQWKLTVIIFEMNRSFLDRYLLKSTIN